jgi:hypothetical protein
MTGNVDGNVPRLKPAVEKALVLEDDVRRALALRGLGLVVSWPRSGDTITAHWQVNDGLGRRVDFWPASNRWRTPDGSRSGVVDFLWEIVAVAAWVVGETCREKAAPACPPSDGCRPGNVSGNSAGKAK